MDEVPFDGLRRAIEERAVVQRAAELEVFGMRPDERHSRAGRMADVTALDRECPRCPRLAREEPASPAKVSIACASRSATSQASGGELVMGSLASEQRPGATNAGPVVRVRRRRVRRIASP